MNIIGKTKDGYIISLTERECANVMGFYSEYDNNIPRTLPVGFQASVTEMFTKAQEALTAYKTMKDFVAKIISLNTALLGLMEESKNGPSA